VVGSSRVYGATHQLPGGAVANDPIAPQYGPPTSGPVYGAAPAGPPPPARRGPGVPLLAGLAVLLLLVGVMTALFITKNSELGDTKQDVAAQEDKIKDLEQQVQKAKDDLAAARQDLTGTQNAQQETQRQKQVMSKCLNLIADLGRAAERNDQTAYNKAAKDLDKACAEAEKYLD
jgi:septal ring factor EnvC (AmiA/AmiB activator)